MLKARVQYAPRSAKDSLPWVVVWNHKTRARTCSLVLAAVCGRALAAQGWAERLWNQREALKHIDVDPYVRFGPIVFGKTRTRDHA